MLGRSAAYYRSMVNQLVFLFPLLDLATWNQLREAQSLSDVDLLRHKNTVKIDDLINTYYPGVQFEEPELRTASLA